MPLPTSQGNTLDTIPTFSDAKNVAMYASCQNRGTAWDFLKYSTSIAEDGKLLAMTGQMPMRQGIQQLYASYFKANPAYTEFAAEAAHVIEVPIVPNSVEMWQPSAMTGRIRLSSARRVPARRWPARRRRSTSLSQGTVSHDQRSGP